MWSFEVEQQVTDLFELAFSATNADIVENCVQGLMGLGLSIQQIENGMMAGAVQMAVDLGIAEILRDVFMKFEQERPKDAAIVLSSVLLDKAC